MSNKSVKVILNKVDHFVNNLIYEHEKSSNGTSERSLISLNSQVDQNNTPNSNNNILNSSINELDDVLLDKSTLNDQD